MDAAQRAMRLIRSMKTTITGTDKTVPQAITFKSCNSDRPDVCGNARVITVGSRAQTALLVCAGGKAGHFRCRL
jgi:hypothetical protein